MSRECIFSSKVSNIKHTNQINTLNMNCMSHTTIYIRFRVGKELDYFAEIPRRLPTKNSSGSESLAFAIFQEFSVNLVGIFTGRWCTSRKWNFCIFIVCVSVLHTIILDWPWGSLIHHRGDVRLYVINIVYEEANVNDIQNNCNWFCVD